MKTLTRQDVMEMSPGDLVIELAKRGVKLEEMKGMVHGKATCPHCGKEGTIAKDFGVRIMRGAIWPQSWCRDCRAGKTKPARRHVENKVARPVHKNRKHVVAQGRRGQQRAQAQARSLGNF